MLESRPTLKLYRLETAVSDPTTIRSTIRSGDLIEKAIPYLLGVGFAIWLAISVATGVSHAMDRASHALVAAATPTP